ncbi:unnamed protein product [Protopolystoma xenopodis]|uniref:Uncharacterized protein n=1 Tax=Protopolystoma xenopodis TaxID=117903 RepID=A0A448WU75_9PLAT|nr:unnamed protein product [Protopolystoma xenopodis]
MKFSSLIILANLVDKDPNNQPSLDHLASSHVIPASAANESTSSSIASSLLSPPSPSLVSPPNMWTRQDLIEFKTTLAEDSDSVMMIGSGEMITVSILLNYVLSIDSRKSIHPVILKRLKKWKTSIFTRLTSKSLFDTCLSPSDP